MHDVGNSPTAGWDRPASWNAGARRWGRAAGAGLALTTLAVGLARLPLPSAAALAGGAGAALLLVRWPWLIWLPLALLLPVTSSLRVGPASMTDLLLAVGLALWFFDGARRRTLRIYVSPLTLALLAYVVVLLLASLAAPSADEALREVIKWLELLALLLVAPALLTARQGRWLAAALVLGAAGQALYGLYQFIFQIGPEYFAILGRFMRASGSFGQPNPFGGYLGLTLPVAVSLALWAWSTLLRSATRSPGAVLWAIFYTAAAGVIAAGLVASWSRGAWLGAAVGVGIVLVLRSRTAAIISGVTLLAVLVALLFGILNPALAPAPLVERVQDIPAYFGMTDALNQPVTDANYAVLERLAHWTAAQRMWESAPWLGVGPGNFNTVYPLVRLPRWDIALGHAHNIFLNVLAETGILGLLAYTCLLATAAVFVWRRFRSASRRQDPDARWFAALTIGVLGVLGHLLTHNLVDNLHVQGMVLQLGLWLLLVSQQAGGEGR